MILIEKVRESLNLGDSHYNKKDGKKFSHCHKIIARGSKRSSSNRYALIFGGDANTGEYDEDDVVGISAEGNRSGRVPPDFIEIQKAASATATFITDNEYDRTRPYNRGEREVAEYLTSIGYAYHEQGFGIWLYSNEN